MARLLTGLLLLWGLTIGLSGEPIRIATYNVRNYLLVDRWLEGQYRPGYPKPEVEKKALRSTILSVRPDILVIQEMGSGPYLEELQSDLKSDGFDLPFRYVADGPDEDRHLALLSRIEPLRLTTHTDLEFTYFNETIPVKRGLLEAVFQTGGYEWKVFSLHLKSKWTDYKEDPQSNDRRRSEALAVRKRILELQQQDGLPFLVLGDFNDTKSSAPLRLLQSRGDTVVATAIEAFDSRGDRWTHYYAAEDIYTRVDFILKSPDFPAAVVGGHVRIHEGPDALVASDHRLVWTDLEFPPAE